MGLPLRRCWHILGFLILGALVYAGIACASIRGMWSPSSSRFAAYCPAVSEDWCITGWEDHLRIGGRDENPCIASLSSRRVYSSTAWPRDIQSWSASPDFRYVAVVRGSWSWSTGFFSKHTGRTSAHVADTATGDQIGFYEREEPISWLSWSADGAMAAATTSKQTILLFSVSRGKFELLEEIQPELGFPDMKMPPAIMGHSDLVYASDDRDNVGRIQDGPILRTEEPFLYHVVLQPRHTVRLGKGICPQYLTDRKFVACEDTAENVLVQYDLDGSPPAVLVKHPSHYPVRFLPCPGGQSVLYPLNHSVVPQSLLIRWLGPVPCEDTWLHPLDGSAGVPLLPALNRQYSVSRGASPIRIQRALDYLAKLAERG